MRLLLIVNPSASSVTERTRVLVQKAFAADHTVAVAETSRRGHATRLAQNAASSGVEVVAVLGGDGTQNEAANGLAGSSCALAVLPGGSTNVFARTIGLQNDAEAATAQLVDALAAGSISTVGLGSVNGRYFLFHTGVGFDAAVVENVERRGTLKRWFGHPLFVLSTFQTWLAGYGRRTDPFTVSAGGAETDSSFAICLNTSPYTYLGNRPLELTDQAGLDRGLVMITLRSLGLIGLSRVAGAALGPTGVVDHPLVDHCGDLTGATVTSSTPFPYQVDGDYLGETTALTFAWHPDSLALVTPTDANP